MNDFLDELYGTREKLAAAGADSDDQAVHDAAAEFLVKLAADEGVDLDQLSDDEIGELLSSIEQGGADEGQEKTAEQQALLENADFFGRAACHAYLDEMYAVEKEAASLKGGYEAVKGAIGRAGSALKSGAEKARDWTGIGNLRQAGRERKAGEKLVRFGKTRSKERGISQELKDRAGEDAARKFGRAAKEKKEGLKRLATRVGLPAAGLAAIGGGGYAAGRTKKSADAEFEDMARERAYELLAEAGYDVEKQAQADYAQHVDAAALQMLEEAGYPVQWNV